MLSASELLVFTGVDQVEFSFRLAFWQRSDSSRYRGNRQRKILPSYPGHLPT